MAKEPKISFQDLEVGKLEALLLKVQPLLEAEDFQLLDRVITTLVLFLDCIQKKNMSIRRLLRMIFGPKTESSRNLLPKDKEKEQEQDQAAAPNGQSSGSAGANPPSGKRKGHGRNGAEDYTGAERIFVPHQELQAGDLCPLCPKGGRLYDTRQPALFIRVVAQPIFRGTIYELMRLRCNLCGAVFTARAPAEAGTTKYSEEVPSMLAILCYGNGMPLTRIESLQLTFGVPLPAGTQWYLLWAAAQLVMPVFNCLIAEAAQAWLFYHDDTHMKVLSLLKENQAQTAKGSKERTGIFTTGILAEVDGHRIALFFTGRKHAGENLDTVLDQRQEGLPVPIQMSDGLASNQLKTAQTRQANCCCHSRRKYVEVMEAFPEQCRLVLETLKEVYRNDATTKELMLSPGERLKFHQTHSQKPMEALEKWAREQIDQKKIEPNSDLGQAIGYMLKRWEKLTLFLREPGAPLDNNACEQILKRAVRHRRNSLFYKTERGALVGDLFMSLIETCRFCHVNPLDYLTALQKHARLVNEHPEQWLPWNHQAALAAANSS
jgi:transposase